MRDNLLVIRFGDHERAVIDQAAAQFNLPRVEFAKRALLNIASAVMRSAETGEAAEYQIVGGQTGATP